MIISLNGKPVDITLDTEKTLGDVLSGLENWISSSGSRIKHIFVNGEPLSANSISEEFEKKVEEIKELDIIIISWGELAVEALNSLLETCILFEKTPFSDRGNLTSDWDGGPASRFLSTEVPDIYSLSKSFFSGEGLSSNDLIILIEERIREAENPRRETENSRALVEGLSKRMEELPLDMQTGKDLRAAETIQLFSRVCEKLFRILTICKMGGLPLDSFKIEELPAFNFMEEFNSALRELSIAYENQDTVLTGDIAEYELSPRILKLHAALIKFLDLNSPAISNP
ncbi:MAG: hypothetical protein FWG77_07915 [Treponema sp.]|nr:hypothetical protein [Treponema sp.]